MISLQTTVHSYTATQKTVDGPSGKVHTHTYALYGSYYVWALIRNGVMGVVPHRTLFLPAQEQLKLLEKLYLI